MPGSKERGKGRRNRSGWWFDIFEEMERMDRLMEDMLRKSVEMPRASQSQVPFVHGFSMSLDSEGRPVIREFGNVEPGREGPQLKEEREPLVDVMESDGDVVVVSELPGVEREDIRLEATDRQLKVTVDSSKRRFLKEMELPHLVNPATARAVYKNGVLEVRFSKSSHKQPARSIKVE